MNGFPLHRKLKKIELNRYIARVSQGLQYAVVFYHHNVMKIFSTRDTKVSKSNFPKLYSRVLKVRSMSMQVKVNQGHAVVFRCGNRLNIEIHVPFDPDLTLT